MWYVARAANNENHQSASKQRRVAQKKNKKNKKTQKKTKKTKKTKKQQNFFYTPVLCVVNYERNGWVNDVIRCKGL